MGKTHWAVAVMMRNPDVVMVAATHNMADLVANKYPWVKNRVHYASAEYFNSLKIDCKVVILDEVEYAKNGHIMPAFMHNPELMVIELRTSEETEKALMKLIQ